MFFDFDGQQDNLQPEDQYTEDVMLQMLQSFDNETENGKLYISYPMVEALRDYSPDSCEIGNDCFWDSREDADSYKKISADRSIEPSFDKFSFQEWKDVINVFAMRISCLMNESEILSYQMYGEIVSPETIYEAQNIFVRQGKVFILSAFPEFLLDYFQEKFWRSCIMHTKVKKRNSVSGYCDIDRYL